MRGCRVLFPASQTLLCLQALLKLLPYLEAFAYHLFVCVCVCVQRPGRGRLVRTMAGREGSAPPKGEAAGACSVSGETGL